MSLQRLSQRGEEQVGQKREWCSVGMEHSVGGDFGVASDLGICCIERD
jgi:hypothetical protein